MNTFSGNWVDQAKAHIEVSGDWNVVSVKYDNGRGPFQGYSVELADETLNVNFNDAGGGGAVVGILVDSDIHWSNGTVWTKAKA